MHKIILIFLICGGHDLRLKEVSSKVKLIDGSCVNNVKYITPMNHCRSTFEAVCLKGEVYVFGGRNNANNLVKSVERYSFSTNIWKNNSNMFDERKNFCVCAFMNKIYIFGGLYIQNLEVIDSCLQFDTKDNNLKTVSEMLETRCNAACVVFQGNAVVSGGINNDEHKLNTVESYDVFADKWSSMPNMLKNKYLHNSVVIKDKLFVINIEFINIQFVNFYLNFLINI